MSWVHQIVYLETARQKNSKWCLLALSLLQSTNQEDIHTLTVRKYRLLNSKTATCHPCSALSKQQRYAQPLIHGASPEYLGRRLVLRVHHLLAQQLTSTRGAHSVARHRLIVYQIKFTPNPAFKSDITRSAGKCQIISYSHVVGIPFRWPPHTAWTMNFDSRFAGLTSRFAASTVDPVALQLTFARRTMQGRGEWMWRMRYVSMRKQVPVCGVGPIDQLKCSSQGECTHMTSATGEAWCDRALIGSK